jgi:hypothetical protein
LVCRVKAPIYAGFVSVCGCWCYCGATFEKKAGKSKKVCYAVFSNEDTSMSVLIKPRGAPARARARLAGREEEIRRALADGGETVTALARRLGVSRPTLTAFIRERLEGGADAAEKQEK